MWKLIVAFVVFAGLSMFVIMQGGDNLNMAGEQHGGETSHEHAAPAQPASAGAEATPPAAPAAGVQADSK